MLVQFLGNEKKTSIVIEKEKQTEKRGIDETERQAEKMGNDVTERQAENMTNQSQEASATLRRLKRFVKPIFLEMKYP